MKINRTGYAQFVQKLEKSIEKNNISSKSGEKDTIKLSEASQKIKDYAKAMKTMDFGNANKVESIKAKLQAGTYKVSSRELADRILAEINQQMYKEK